MKEDDQDQLFRKWEVLERWVIDSITLAKYVRDKQLPAYDSNGKRVPSIEDIIVINSSYNEEKLLAYLADRITWFIIDDVKDFEHIHGIQAKSEPPSSQGPDTAPAQQSPLKKRTAKQIAAQNAKQLVKEEVRAVAIKLWKKDPSITKADMAMHDEINSVPGATDRTPKTLENWIADLNPDRSKGRRPKKT